VGATLFARRPGLRPAALTIVASLGASAVPERTPTIFAAGLQRGHEAGQTQSRPPDFERMAHHQAETDGPGAPRARASGRSRRSSYRSSLGDFEIPDASAWRVDLTLSAVT
jgi:hypothetical protein